MLCILNIAWTWKINKETICSEKLMSSSVCNGVLF